MGIKWSGGRRLWGFQELRLLHEQQQKNPNILIINYHKWISLFLAHRPRSLWSEKEVEIGALDYDVCSLMCWFSICVFTFVGKSKKIHQKKKCSACRFWPNLKKDFCFLDYWKSFSCSNLFITQIFHFPKQKRKCNFLLLIGFGRKFGAA